MEYRKPDQSISSMIARRNVGISMFQKVEVHLSQSLRMNKKVLL